MNKGYSLHIGVNSINPLHYHTSGRLDCCQNDALAMQELLNKNSFITSTLFTERATRKNVINKWVELTKKAQKGDLVVITYSGHGSFIPDLNNEKEETDGRDETWCLYDAQLIDDEILCSAVSLRLASGF